MPVNQNKAIGPKLLPETSIIQPGSDGVKKRGRQISGTEAR